MHRHWHLGIALLVCAATGITACEGHSGRNVFGNPSDDQLLSSCTTGRGTSAALYINEGGGAAVGTSWPVTAERKPRLPERQIIYSEQSAILSLNCKSQGFDLTTSKGLLHFKDSDVAVLRESPENLDSR